MELETPAILPIQPEELEILQPRERMPMSIWAERHYALTAMTSRIVGPWRNEYVPWLIEPMDRLSESGPAEVVLRKCAQAGGTELGNIFVGYTIDQAPAPTLIVMPREDDVNRRVATRIGPMFRACGLASHLPGGRLSNLNVGKETILDTMILYLAWAGSAAALADNPICNVVLDEVGKYPARTGREADPVSLARNRQRTFKTRRKLLIISTPVAEGDLIDQAWEAGDRRRWWVLCPLCSAPQVMEWENVSLDKEKDNKTLLSAETYRNGGFARYLCPGCKRPWTEEHRWQAVSNGRWLPHSQTLAADGTIEGTALPTRVYSYHIDGMMLYPGFLSIDDLAADWATANVAKHGGDVLPLQDFFNSKLGLPWREREAHSDERELLKHRGTYKCGELSELIQVVVAGVDVQIDHVYCVVLGWGWLSQVWLIDAFRIKMGDTEKLANWDTLRQALRAEFILPGMELRPERRMHIRRTGVDCGYRQDVVLDFCRQCQELSIVPVKGDDRVKNIWRSVPVAGKRTAPGSLNRYDLNTDALKDRLHRFISSPEPGPGYMHLPADVDLEVLSQLCSEERIVVQRRPVLKYGWQVRRGKKNHYLDAMVYAIAVAEILGVRMLPDPEHPLPRLRRRIGKLDRFRQPNQP